MLSISDASNKALEEKQNLKSENLILQPLKNADEKTMFFAETREKHVSGTGDVIKWIASINGIYTNIVYYTADVTQINTVDLLTKAQSVNVIEKK